MKGIRVLLILSATLFFCFTKEKSKYVEEIMAGKAPVRRKIK
jgi:hypothetical protein